MEYRKFLKNKEKAFGRESVHHPALPFLRKLWWSLKRRGRAQSPLDLIRILRYCPKRRCQKKCIQSIKTLPTTHREGADCCFPCIQMSADAAQCTECRLYEIALRNEYCTAGEKHKDSSIVLMEF